MALALRFAARSDVGLLRDGNEDSAYAGHRLLVVADGMGGHAAGEVASSVAVATVAALDEDAPGPDLIDRLSVAVSQANDVLRDMVVGDPALEGMGTTLTAMLRSGSRLALVHIGDSRGYLLREGRLQQITHDHTFVQSLVDEGRITEEEADHHPQRNVITRALDGRADVDPDVSVREARVGDRYLLCSDGLSGVVSRDTLEATLREVSDPAQACEELIELALRGGGPDNITCIVADVVEVSTAPPGVPQVVGAAAEQLPAPSDTRQRRGAAERAAALNPRPLRRTVRNTDHDDQDRPVRRRWPRRVLALAVALAVLVGLGWGAYALSQRQYYVGADDNVVAIYQGISQDLLGLSLSHVYSRGDLTTGQLPGSSREQVSSGIPADNLADAHAIVGRLAALAARCATPVPAPRPTPTPTPTGTPARPTAGATTPATPPTAAPTPVTTPTPAPPPRRPRGCEGVEVALR
jgi:protein phosphatase